MRIFPIFLGVIWTQRTRCDATVSSASSTITRRSSESPDRSHSGFVRAPGDGNLYLDGNLFNFRSFNAPTILEGGEFQGRDIFKSIRGFGAPVTRTYTLQIANEGLEYGKIPPSSGHITGWDKNSNDWIYNEDQWNKMDRMLCLSRHYGVKLIIPIINQAYGNPEINHVGDFNDLIRHRYGIWGYLDAGKRVDFFKDRTMVNSFKSLITFFLNRVNTCNGIRYGDDNTILAFETGNELNWGSYANISSQPAPAQWTIEISRHLKRLAPNILVMDGSFSRHPSFAWEEEALKSKEVDIFGYHFYGNGDTELFDMLNAKVRKYGKTLVIGEHGFYSDVHVWRAVYQRMTCAGALAWSLLPHSEQGGFLTHSEGHNIYAYHVPGWERQTSPNFDTYEHEVISSTYDASYVVLGLEPPPKPIPGRPEAFIVVNGSRVGLSWRGEAWAAGYEIFGAEAWERNFHLISDVIPDNVEAGELFIPLDPERPTDSLRIPARKSKSREPHKGWRDRKWCWINRLFHRGCQDDDDDDDRYRAHHHQANSLLDMLGNLIGRSSMTVLPPMEPLRHRHRQHPGGWYAVRGVSADGIRGKLSRPIFLDAAWRSEDSS